MSEANALVKKTILLKQKILMNSAITHNKQQYQLQTLKNDEAAIKQQIKSDMIVLKQLLNCSLNEYSQLLSSILEKMEDSNGDVTLSTFRASDALNASSKVSSCKNIDVTQVGQVKKYLNAQKKTLQELIESYSSQNGELSQKIQDVKNTQQKLHQLSRTKKLQQILSQVQKKQLEKQIRYLEYDICGKIPQSSNKKQNSHSMVNKKSRHHQIIYIPDENMTEKQEQQYNNKILVLLNQLQRLVKLEAICSHESKSKDNSMGKAHMCISILNKQANRLSKMQKIIKQERDKFDEIQKWANGIDKFLLGTPGLATKNMGDFSLQSMSCNEKTQLNEQDLEQEIGAIIQGLSNRNGEIIGSRVCLEEQISQNLKVLKNKAKRTGI